jgi:hypothetical protein
LELLDKVVGMVAGMVAGMVVDMVVRGNKVEPVFDMAKHMD